MKLINSLSMKIKRMSIDKEWTHKNSFEKSIKRGMANDSWNTFFGTIQVRFASYKYKLRKYKLRNFTNYSIINQIKWLHNVCLIPKSSLQIEPHEYFIRTFDDRIPPFQISAENWSRIRQLFAKSNTAHNMQL